MLSYHIWDLSQALNHHHITMLLPFWTKEQCWQIVQLVALSKSKVQQLLYNNKQHWQSLYTAHSKPNSTKHIPPFPLMHQLGIFANCFQRVKQSTAIHVLPQKQQTYGLYAAGLKPNSTTNVPPISFEHIISKWPILHFTLSQLSMS
jgi:hypothetical protein